MSAATDHPAHQPATRNSTPRSSRIGEPMAAVAGGPIRAWSSTSGDSSPFAPHFSTSGQDARPLRPDPSGLTLSESSSRTGTARMRGLCAPPPSGLSLRRPAAQGAVSS